MAVETATFPAFARGLIGLSDEDRASLVKAVHGDYAENAAQWQVLLDAFEGRGGFLDGSYLWRFPREEDAGYTSRKTAARYHNYLEALVDIYVRFIWTQGVKRTSSSAAYNEWLKDVDGDGMSMDDFLKRLTALALSGGHAGALVDKTREAPAGPTRAEESARVVLTWFPATDILDWRFSRSEITGVKLREVAQAATIAEAPKTGDESVQYLLWGITPEDDGWARFDFEGKPMEGGVTGLGLVPFVVLRPKPSNRSYMLGRPLVSNANIVCAMFNRHSEEDQVLRDQAFSILTVNVSPEADVDQARGHIAGAIGTTRALVTHGDIKYATPDMAVPQAIRDNVVYLAQEIYRAAHVRFRRDSLQSETAEAIRLQYTELNEALQGLAKALSSAERKIARAWFGWTEATPEAAEAAFEKADPTAEYPQEFFLDALIADIQAWAESIALGLGAKMTQRIKKRAVRRIEPDISPEDLKEIDAEIEALPSDELGLNPPAFPPDVGNPEDGGEFGRRGLPDGRRPNGAAQ